MRVAAAGLAALLVCFSVGCPAPAGAKVAKASGLVTYKGDPVANAKVMFHPVNGGARTSYGTTDETGRFKMRTFGLDDGALLGQHQVTITLVELPEEATKIDPEAMKKGGIAAGMPGYEKMMGIGGTQPTIKPTFVIPEKYSNKDTSNIQCDVLANEDNDFTFEITD